MNACQHKVSVSAKDVDRKKYNKILHMISFSLLAIHYRLRVRSSLSGFCSLKSSELCPGLLILL